jgi:hypothetical protein
MVKPLSGETSMKSKTLQIIVVREHSSMEFIWDPHKSQASHKKMKIDHRILILYKL